jgi:hypothetical protein
MNDKKYLKEMYKLFISNINNVNIYDRQNKKYIKFCIENYLDNSVLSCYASKYEAFEYIYDIENSKSNIYKQY